jgi:FixJ family two-component response regulator
LVTDGETNKQIAGELKISERTVEVHQARVMEKLSTTIMAQLVLCPGAGQTS